ncbi:MAG TPA: Ig-like domain-containing protein, partial [Gemmatimonadales bacterium]|nr:Ig-like domain-containing protein [Gemmatimonadales bacterium]
MPLLLLLATCQVDKLTTNPPPVARLMLAPGQVQDSAAVGSMAAGGDSLSVQNGGPGTLSWVAHLANGESWVAFVGPNSGTAPATLRIAFNPAGLAMGVYRDTVIVDAENAANSPGRVPVEFTVHPCVPSAIVLDAQLADSLTTRDCSAPHRANSFARVYSFTAKAGDSVAVFMSSAALDAYVVLDTSLAASAPPLAQNDNCGSGLDACLPYQKLPIAGTYLIEATAGAGQTGAFTLKVTRPRSPTGLAQFQSDGITPILKGGTATSSSVVFKATVADPSLGSQLRLEVEVEPIGTAFANVASGSGTAVANGGVAVAAVAGLRDNTGYHWQARAVDQTGRGGLWGSFGANAETDPDFRLAGTATQIAMNAGNNQTVTAGTSVPIPPSVIVTDAGGHPVPGAAVTFAVASGGGSITGPTKTTDANGIATVGSWTLGAVAGSNTLTAASDNLTGSPVTFTATGTAGNAGSLAVNAGNNQTATVNTAVATPPSVIVKDGNGNPVAGVAVTFATTSRSGTVTGTSRTSNASGIATVGSWTLGTAAGPDTLTATSTGLNGSPVLVIATGTAGAPSPSNSLIGATPSTITASSGASASTINVTVNDQFGNPVSGATVTLAATPTTGITLTQPVAQTNTGGQASGTLSSTKAETKTVTATVNGTTVVTATATVTVNTGPAAIIAVNAGNNQTVAAGTGVPVAPSVVVTDAHGNPVAGVAVTFAVASGGGSITGASQTTTASGLATVGSWTLGTVAGTNTLTATSGSLTGSPVTFTATGTAGNAGSIAANSGTNQTATVNTAVATPPAVIVKDGNGNPVAGVAVTFATTSRSGSVTGASQTTTASGIATVGSWTLGTVAGPDTLTATAPGVNGSPVLVIATGSADAPSASRSLVSATPGTITASSGSVAATITVTALDQFGNPVPGKTVALSASPVTGTTVTQPAAVTDGNGVTSGALSSTKAETKTVAATIGGVAITPQATVTVTPAAPSNVNFVVQPPASTTAGATLTPAVQVEIRDPFNNRVTGATNGVTLALGTNPSGGTLTGGTPAVTPASGVASFASLAIDKAGTGYTLAAASPNLTGQTSSTFNITTGTATSVALNGGSAQTDTIGATLAIPYSVKVTDAQGNPVSGVTVTWAVTGGGSITPSSVTAATGIATATR